MSFFADTMLGKLSRWLRILGYDTVYFPEMSPEQLAEAARGTDSLFLTRRTWFNEKALFKNVVFIPHDKFEDQLRFIVEQCGLKIGGPLFTRCLKCNVKVDRIPKDQIEGKVPPRTFEGTCEFYVCPGCNSIYWKGTHYRNTVKKIESIFNPIH